MRLIIIGVFVSTFLVGGTARAHPLLDKAVQAYEQADFDGALDTFTEVEGRSDLSTEDLLRLFEWRALVYHAMDDDVRMRADLRRLASIRPTYRLGQLAPPSVQTAFDQVREAIAGGISIDLSAEALPGRLRLLAQVRRDVTNIGRSLEIYARIGDGDWVKSVGERAVVSVPPGGSVAYYAVLTGPGGAIITSDASREQPRVAEVPQDGQYVAEQKPGVPTAAWATWGVAGGALIGAAVSGGMALKRDKALKSGCGSTPQGCSDAERKRVTTPALATDIMLITAGVAAITGTVLFFVLRKKEREELAQSKVQVGFTPWATPKSAGGTATVEF